MKQLEIKAAIQIAKSPREIFEAIVDPAQMANYFISQGSGRMETGATLQWKFPEFDEEFPIRVGNIEQDKSIAYSWDSEDGRELLVEIRLEPTSDGRATVVRVTEKSMPVDDAGLAWLGGNSGGWANFLASLKAWLEYGINLRKGAFEFMRQ